ncbi:MAG: hypothetical protein EB141_17270 [Verrucomicrobia bacterium]|nr:hypothetical protein [Verrucomicrobiota bacterium]NBU09711.1 hypothetical protein [Pseudomonadota bacterium]NDA66535.1 hypothetical protein [Verrucomicrobiota bacterium]NDB77363.1 hypothetical protein [Verrucomicrobiota bacterium]NDD38091.1 hypothetical protein [Verrucomicrobiota bacterium]
MNLKANMKNTMFEELLALRHKRTLTSDERAWLERWLAAHPTDHARWREENALATALRRLPEPAVPTNFMARVWQDIESANRPGNAARARGWAWWRWPSLAQQFALAVVLLAAIVVIQGRRARSPVQVARSIEQVTAFTQMPSVALLKDFEAISRLNQAAADVELLAAFEPPR